MSIPLRALCGTWMHMHDCCKPNGGILAQTVVSSEFQYTGSIWINAPICMQTVPTKILKKNKSLKVSLWLSQIRPLEHESVWQFDIWPQQHKNPMYETQIAILRNLHISHIWNWQLDMALCFAAGCYATHFINFFRVPFTFYLQIMVRLGV